MAKTVLSAVAVALLFLCLNCGRAKDSIQIKGSDTMVNLAQTWAEVYMQNHPQVFVAVTGGGSGTGISSLMSGSCNIAMSSRTIKNKEISLAEKKGIEPKEIEAALDGIAVVVHPQNPVSKLTVDQLALIFTGKITNWREVGGSDSRIVVLSREVNSGTHVYFKEHVLRKGDPNSKCEFAARALLLSSSQAIADEVAQNPSAIGYYGIGYISERQKAIMVSMNEQAGYVSPTTDKVISGEYPVSRPLFLYTNGQPQGMVKDFIDFCLSPEGQQIVLDTEFIPIVK